MRECKCDSKIKKKYTDFMQPAKYPVQISFVIFFIVFIIAGIVHDISVLSAVVASIGLIFIALKYRMDQASYHKALFTERLEIFNAINEALVSCYKNASRQEINQKITPILNKSYFLFSDKTYAFIRELSDHLIAKAGEPRSEAERGPSSITKEQSEKAHLFSEDLLSERELAKKFPELKIDTY